MHIPESIKHGGPTYRPNRAKTQELSGTQFWPQHTGDHLLPNPSPTCTWNTMSPYNGGCRHSMKVYPKSLVSLRDSTDTGGELASASQVENMNNEAGVA